MKTSYIIRTAAILFLICLLGYLLALILVGALASTASYDESPCLCSTRMEESYPLPAVSESDLQCDTDAVEAPEETYVIEDTELIVESEPVAEIEGIIADEPTAPVEPVLYQGPALTLTEDERHLFASLIFLEAGGESWECQLGCGSVVINRMNVGGQSIMDVMYAPYQFSVAPLMATTQAPQQSYDAVDYLIANGVTLPPYVTYFRADYFFDWATPYIVIDNTYFSYSEATKARLGY